MVEEFNYILIIYNFKINNVLSGHKSKTQIIFFFLNNLFIKIMELHLKIGEGQNINIISIFLSKQNK